MNKESFFHTHEKYGQFRIDRNSIFWFFFQKIQYGVDYAPWVKVGFSAVQKNEDHKQALELFLDTNSNLSRLITPVKFVV